MTKSEQRRSHHTYLRPRRAFRTLFSGLFIGVNEEIVVIACEFPEMTIEAVFTVDGTRYFQLSRGKINIRRNDIEIFEDRSNRLLDTHLGIGQEIIGGVLHADRVETKPYTQVPLGIHVHKQHFPVALGEACAKVNRCCGLSAASFLIGDSDDPGHLIPPILSKGRLGGSDFFWLFRVSELCT
jgi:hypothetical protein